MAADLILDPAARLRWRWRQKLKGSKLQAGKWDLYVVVADRLHWTPAMLDSCDPSFVDELQAFLAADAEHTKKELDRLRKDSN